MRLQYVISFKEQKLLIKIEEKGAPRKVLYWDTLSRLAASEDLPPLAFFKQIVTRFSRNLDTLPFNQVEIEWSDGFEAMSRLAKTGRLVYQNKPLVSDWKKEAYFFWKGDDTDQFSAYLQYDSQEIPLESVERIFPNWGIWEGKAFPISASLSWMWIELFLKGPVHLEGVRKKRFLEEHPRIVWKEASPKFLLTDPNGCFGNLSKEHPAWEKDLLEAGYVRKEMGNSRYFAPLEKVREALLLLLDVGWEVILAGGKKLYRQTGSEWKVSSTGEQTLIQGTGWFGEKKGALQKGALWANIDDASAGLFDPKKGEAFEAPVLQKGEEGALLRFLDEPKVEWDAKILETVRGLKVGAGAISILPGPSFQGTLLPHQQKGVDWLTFLHAKGFSGLLADAMGLGKTVQVLAFFSQLRTNLPILIVAPSSLLFHWRFEIERFLLGATVEIYAGPDRILRPSQYVITSYALLRLDQKLLSQIEWEVIALDESSAIKTSSTQTAQAAYQLKGKFRIALNGTPIENRPEELESQFRFLMPHLKMGLQTVKPLILRRQKDELNLPEKLEQIAWVEMEEAQAELYHAYVQGLRSGLLKKIATDGVSAHRMEVLEAILRLRQIAADPRLIGENLPGSKILQLLSDLDEVLAEKRKVLIYSQFTSMLALIAKSLSSPYLYLDGSVPLEERAKRVRQFQEDPEIPIFLLSLKAGGVGLNLTAADYVFLFDPWWNDAVENQAIDRAHRIGQSKTVIAKRYLIPGSIEEKMLQLKAEKSKMAKALLDTGEEFNWTEEDLLHLLS